MGFGHSGACSVTTALLKKLSIKTAECEELKKRLMQKDEVNMFFNTPIEGWDNDLCKICESKNNYEQLKEDYAELKLENKELYRILADLKEARKLKDSYRKALEAIENFTKKHCDFYCEHNRILDIISKAKDGE